MFNMFQLLILTSFCSVVVTADFWAPGDNEYLGVFNGRKASGDHGYPVYNGREEASSSMTDWVPGDEGFNDIEAPGGYGYEEVHNGRDQISSSLKDWVSNEYPGVYNSRNHASSDYGYPEDRSNGEIPGDNRDPGAHNGREQAKSFMNEWTVEVDGTEEVAQLVALELGYVYGGLVSFIYFIVYYHLLAVSLALRCRDSAFFPIFPQ